jgi:hypothetical protein
MTTSIVQRFAICFHLIPSSLKLLDRLFVNRFSKSSEFSRDSDLIIFRSSFITTLCSNFSSFLILLTRSTLVLISPTKRSIKWNDEAEEAFQKLKAALISEPVLVPPNFDREFTIQCDASDVGIGGVLTQVDDEGNERVISYYSKKLTKPEKKYIALRRNVSQC